MLKRKKVLQLVDQEQKFVVVQVFQESQYFFITVTQIKVFLSLLIKDRETRCTSTKSTNIWEWAMQFKKGWTGKKHTSNVLVHLPMMLEKVVLPVLPLPRPPPPPPPLPPPLPWFWWLCWFVSKFPSSWMVASASHSKLFRCSPTLLLAACTVIGRNGTMKTDNATGNWGEREERKRKWSECVFFARYHCCLHYWRTCTN